ncbi:hypothetical protein F7725_011056 [Dissostichus mawsoni]|uniref:Presequence protease, mitochondrial n=1 Tax=Dissostichus mawsoni TaxID=36200 RepID=A0A7J5Z7W1_DISMA|nr:hypothetical protein F7725_011056 [Dissostichus mawsoni]
MKSTKAQERACQYQAGQKIHGFTVREVVVVPDLFLTAVKLTHDKTGAHTGVPHILEHTVLCGSEKYPCRDPFFKMLTRSLSTFMNAFTASDYTMYPFSTQNGKDFQNLLSVYLDAVSSLVYESRTSGEQEGWRLEHEDPKDLSTPLVFKGVVFNEMKGAFSENERVYAQHLQNKLFPDHTYSVVSGGEPLDIPDLTWEQLKQFHATHYHPSNARFFTYGDLPLEQHLKQIEEEALSRFERINQHGGPVTAPLEQPYHVTCGPDAMAPDPKRQDTLCVSFLLGDITDTFEGFTLSLLSSLMMSGPNSPFYKALIEPNIGTDFSSVAGYDGSTKEASFSIGLQGMAEEDTERVKQIIRETIDDIIEKGFEEERIEALLHKIEIQMKHQSTNFGLSLASYIASSWNHDGNPVELLQISDSVTQFRKALTENPRFLQDKVKHYFKENTHRLTLSMSPDETYVEKQAKAEEEKLQKKIQALSDSDKKEIYEKGLELLAAQSKTQDASCLPALKVSDIEPTIPITPVQISTAADQRLVYFRAMCSLNTLPGTQALRAAVLQRRHKDGLWRSGLQAAVSAEGAEDGGDVRLSSRLSDSAQLDMYEQERLRVLVMMSAQELANGIAYSGHMYAMTRACRHLTPSGDLQETFGGMEQVKFMKKIAEMSDLSQVIRILPRIKKHLLNPDNMSGSAGEFYEGRLWKQKDTQTCQKSYYRGEALRGKLDNSSQEPLDPQGGSGLSRKLISEVNFQPCQMKTFFQMPFPINFISESIRTVPFAHEDYASFSTERSGRRAGLMGAEPGWEADSSPLLIQGPELHADPSAFRRGVDWAKSGDFSQQDIDEAKLSVFSAVDSPVAPASKGMGRFLSGVTDEMLQGHRERLFAVSHRSLVEVAERYLGVGQRTCGVAILGPENEAIKKDPSWIVK